MIWPKTVKDKIWESNEVKLLGQTISNKFKFNSHITNVYYY